jgi:hypothetical protein
MAETPKPKNKERLFMMFYSSMYLIEELFSQAHPSPQCLMERGFVLRADPLFNKI